MNGPCQYEIDVLRHIGGADVPSLAWGAAMGAAIESLKGRGLIFRNHEHAYKLTEEGRAALFLASEQTAPKA